MFQNNPEATWTAFEIGRIVKNYKQNGYTPSNTDAVIDEKAVLDAIAQNKNTSTENVEGEKVKSVKGSNANQYSLNIVHSNDQIETLNDARSLTKEQAVEYLNQAKSGTVKRNTYIPVRSDTPQVIIDTVAQVGENIGNHSLVMQVRKAQQAMSTENPGAKNKAYGSNVRKHALTPEKIVDIVNNIDNTNLIVYQTNRQDKNGNALPNNVAVFVEYNDNGNEGVAVIEFDGLTSDSEFVGSEAGDTNYHTVVTVFEPDTQRNGMPFDYAEEILSNPDNIELQIVRRPNERSATGEKHPNTSNELPSDNTIPQTPDEVNTEKYPTVSRDGIEIKPESDPEVQKRLSEAKDDIERTGILSGASEHTIALARRLEKLLGVKIRFELNPIGTHKNGRYNRVEDTIYVNMSEDNDAVIQIIVHEFIHAVEGTRLHASLFRFAEKMLDRNHGKGTFKNKAHETIKDYEKRGEELTLPQAQNEVVCNFIADNLLKDEEIIKHFVREHRTLAERFQRLIDRVLLVFTKDEARTEVKTRLALEKANRLYKDAMKTRKTGADLKARVDELRQKYQNGEITEEEFDSSVDELDNEAKGIGLSIDDFFKGGGDSFSITEKPVAKRKRTMYNEYNTNGMQWAYNGSTDIGDIRTLYKPAAKKYALIKATKEDIGFIELSLGTLQELQEEMKNYERRRQQSSGLDTGKTTSVGWSDDFEMRQGYESWHTVDAGDTRGRGRTNVVHGTGVSEEFIDRTESSSKISGDSNERINIPDTDNTDSYSISTPVFTPEKIAKEVVDKAESNIDIAERLPKKAHNSLRQVEKKLCEDIAKVYGIRYDRISELQEGVRKLVNEYLTDGSIDEKNTLRGYFADFMKEKIH